MTARDENGRFVKATELSDEERETAYQLACEKLGDYITVLDAGDSHLRPEPAAYLEDIE